MKFHVYYNPELDELAVCLAYLVLQLSNTLVWLNPKDVHTWIKIGEL